MPRVGELIGGSVREENLEKLRQQMESKNIPEKGYEFYLDLRKFGTAPHAGFGIGFERLLQYSTGVTNIKDVIPVPRFFGECKF